jgi:transcriptional regulator with XRE-family HTH domain
MNQRNVEPLDVGEQIRQIRRWRGLTQSDLAEASGLSSNTLSLIERGQSSPTLSTLQKIAAALQIDINDFFAPSSLISRVCYIKTYQRSPVPLSKGSIANLASGFPDSMFAPAILRLETGARSGPFVAHKGQELIFCLRGQLLYIVETRAFLLEPGDSLMFDSTRPHRWQNAGDETVEALLIICPVDFEADSLLKHFTEEDLSRDLSPLR